MAGDDGYPYGVPLNYVYDEQAGKIYFHSARDGHKLDAIRREPKVSFCVVGKNQLVPEEFTTYFTSVIAFGRATVLTDDREREAALRLLSEKYVKASKERVDAEIAKSFPAVAWWSLPSSICRASRPSSWCRRERMEFPKICRSVGAGHQTSGRL